MHPPQSDAVIRVVGQDHPVTVDLADFTLNDERYSYLETQPDITVLCEQQHDGLDHPMVWARQTSLARVIYDGLGHDTKSFDSPGHVQLLRNSLRWLMP